MEPTLCLSFPRCRVLKGMDVVKWPGIQGHEEAWDGEGHGYPWRLPISRRVEPGLTLGIWEQGGPRSALTAALVSWPRDLQGASFAPVSQRGCAHTGSLPSPPSQPASVPLSVWWGLGA